MSNLEREADVGLGLSVWTLLLRHTAVTSIE